LASLVQVAAHLGDGVDGALRRAEEAGHADAVTHTAMPFVFSPHPRISHQLTPLIHRESYFAFSGSKPIKTAIAITVV
jgi:hypothetical protein